MARYSKATWDPSPNFTANGMKEYRCIVIHIEQGSEAGTDSWFRNPSSQVSAHFSVGKDGAVHQHVDTKDKAWAEVSGNGYCISIEHEGQTGDRLTAQQVTATAGICAWVHATHGIPLVISNDPSHAGVIGHGQGGDAWGGHYDCPGSPILAQRTDIIQVASQNTPGKGSVSPSEPPSTQVEYEDIMKLVYAPGKATCLFGTKPLLRALTGEQVGALAAAGVGRVTVTAAQWEVLDALSKAEG